MRHRSWFVGVVITLLTLVWVVPASTHPPSKLVLDEALSRTVAIGAKFGGKSAVGSGVIVDEHHVVTASHVVTYKGKPSEKIVIRVNDDLKLEDGINVAKWDEEKDIALIQVELDLGFPELKLGAMPENTDSVFATGYLWGHCNSREGICEGPLARVGYWVYGDDNFSTFDIRLVNGMSGGGIWNYNGELVSIAAGVAMRIDAMGIGVANSALEVFLE